jgi:HEAT repeat protein
MKDITGLIGNLTHPERDVRHAAADALGEMGPAAQAAIPALLEALLRSERPGEPYSRALAWIGRPVIPAVLDLIQSDAASQAADGLQIMGRAETLIPDGDHEGGQGQPRRWTPSVWYNLMHILWMIGEPAVPALIGLMGNPNPDVRAFAIQIVAALGLDDDRIIEAATPALLKTLEDPEPAIWQPAALALGRRQLHPRAVVPALEKIRRELESAEPFDAYPNEETYALANELLRLYEEGEDWTGRATPEL